MRLVVALMAVLAAPGNPATAPRASRAAVEERLRAHDVPAVGTWNELGAGVDEALAEVARDEKADPLVRSRALSALGYFPTAAARRCLEELLGRKAGGATAADRLLLRRAAVALGWVGGPDVPSRLGPLLDHADEEVRIDAAIGLGLTRAGSAAELLRKRLAAEPVARVRTQLARQLRAVEDALAASQPRK